MITVFKDFSETKKPHYVDVDTMLLRIKNCKIQQQIDELRKETDKKKQRELKEKLPCILWSGEFKERKDKGIIKHSGFVILDFDKVDDLEILKNEINSHKFVYASFTSPSGNGLKVLVKVPAIIEKHRGYYRALMKIFKDLDPTNINESRICFESVDKDIYINKNAVAFTEYIEDYQKATPLGDKKEFKKTQTDYRKTQIAADMVRNAIDGEKHIVLLKAARLMGGYISGGAVEESEAERILEREIDGKNIEDIAGAKKTIKAGIDFGKKNPIEVLEYEKQKPISKIKSSIPITDSLDFIAKHEDIENELYLWRTNTYPKGLSTGFANLDKYFLFKRGNFNVFNGFDNVGKSTTLWYLCLLSSLLYGWKWVILSSENKGGTVVKRLIEFYWCKPIVQLNDIEYRIAKEFVLKHFTIIKNDTMYNFKDALEMCAKINLVKNKVDGILLDPYNSLKIDLSDKSKLSTHEYHYEASSEMQQFAKLNDICVYLNCHVVTSAMRDGSPPKKADTEGGGKFANKADDFVTIHRNTQSEDWRNTQLHIRKIKELETGGGYTQLDNPFIIRMVNNSCGFEDEFNNNPVFQYHEKKDKNAQKTLKENNDFLTEAKPIITNNTDPF